MVSVGISSETDSALVVKKSKTPTGRIRDPVSTLVRKLLTLNNIGVIPTTGISGGTSGVSTDWPIYTVNVPDIPDNILTIFDTTPVRDGRLMIGGKVVMHPGVQIQIRCNDYAIGYDKSNAVAVILTEKVVNQLVSGVTSLYTIYSLSLISGPLALGKEVSNSKRYLFTVNLTVSLKKSPSQ